MAQISSAFGFDEVVATPRSFAETDKSDCQFAGHPRHFIVPPIESFGLRSAYLLQFPSRFPIQKSRRTDTGSGFSAKYGFTPSLFGVT